MIDTARFAGSIVGPGTADFESARNGVSPTS